MNRCFGTCFKEELLPQCSGKTGKLLHIKDETVVKFVSFFGNKTHMAGDIFDIIAFAPLHQTAGDEHSFTAGMSRDDADALFGILPILIGVGKEHGRDCDVVFPEKFKKCI